MCTGNVIFTQQILPTLEILSQLKNCHNDLKITLVLICQFRKNISIMCVRQSITAGAVIYSKAQSSRSQWNLETNSLHS